MQQLIEQGAFLNLSRTSPEYFEQASLFWISDHTEVTIWAPGIIQFEPKSPTKSIVYSCGIHGNETAPIEICDAMVRDILTSKLRVQHRVLFLFGNLPAMDIAERFVEENMNRLFSGAHAQGGVDNAERQRAKLLEELVEQFFTKNNLPRFHYDLHTAIRASKNEKFAVYPYLHGKKWNRSQIEFLQACGVNTFLLSGSPTTTFSYFSSHQFGAHAFTVELGKVKPFGQNDMSRFAAADRCLRRLICEITPNFASDVDETALLYKINQVINKTHPDFKLHFSDDIPNFTDFAKGTVLASESGNEYCTEQDGEAIVFPNADVALGQRALLTVIPVDPVQLDME
ncbi:succinylglutamate desuccinylase [Neptunicella marina]|uniref:succinylglutamate desuccinylase n=1 Tax=Neptunicella marina TaxID=2125989 RepID=UPI003BB1F998